MPTTEEELYQHNVMLNAWFYAQGWAAKQNIGGVAGTYSIRH